MLIHRLSVSVHSGKMKRGMKVPALGESGAVPVCGESYAPQREHISQAGAVRSGSGVSSQIDDLHSMDPRQSSMLPSSSAVTRIARSHLRDRMTQELHQGCSMRRV